MNQRKCFLLWVFFAFFSFLGNQSVEPPCGRLLEFDGEVYLLRSSLEKKGERNLLGASMNIPLLCRDWISVTEGWAKIQLLDGNSIDVGNHTFFQVNQHPEREVVLYRGVVALSSPPGNHEIRIISSGARARIQNGKAIFLFDSKKDDSQLISISGKVSLENRFLPSERVFLQPGETSILDFQLHRTIPKNPSALSVSHLRSLFLERLHLKKEDQWQALKVAATRADRKLASSLVEEEGLDSEPLPSKPRSLLEYQRHESKPIDQKLKKHLLQKVVGDPSWEEPLLLESSVFGKMQPVQVQVRETFPKPHTQKKKSPISDSLMDSLSRVK